MSQDGRWLLPSALKPQRMQGILALLWHIGQLSATGITVPSCQPAIFFLNGNLLQACFSPPFPPLPVFKNSLKPALITNNSNTEKNSEEVEQMDE